MHTHTHAFHKYARPSSVFTLFSAFLKKQLSLTLYAWVKLRSPGWNVEIQPRACLQAWQTTSLTSLAPSVPQH